MIGRPGNTLPLALRLLAREGRSGELGVLALALLIAVTALTGVGFLVTRISAAVERQASAVLAADLRLGSPQAIGPGYGAEARRRGLAATSVTSLVSVIFRGEQSQLANIEAVSAGYPLRGRLLAADAPFAPGLDARAIPAPGEIWPDSRLLAALGTRIGETLSIGSSTLRIARVLIARPDQSVTFAELAPTVLMNAQDLPATGLIQPGSRVSHAELFAGERSVVTDFKAWLGAHKGASERLRDVTESSPQIRDAVDRAGRFLTLSGLVSVLLCAISVALSARRYVQRHLDVMALLKTLGATRAEILSVALTQLALVAIGAALLGALLGFGTQQLLLAWLRKLLAPGDLPPPDLLPALLGLVTALAVLAGFAVPQLLQLARVPALRVLRRDLGAPPLAVWAAFLPAAGIIVALIAVVIHELRLTGWIALGLAVFVAVLTAAGAALVRLAAGIRGGAGAAWRFGLASLARRRTESITQVVAFGTGLMVLLLLALVRGELDRDWRRTLPADVPNFFFINIPPAQREDFVAALRSVGAQPRRLLPMVRGRLVEVNGQPVERLRLDQNGEGFATREQNLTWEEAPGADNRIIAGSWWGPADRGRALVSLATEFQEALGLKVGDRLTFDLAGERLVAQVASIRKVKWDSFQPNFFIVFPPGVLDSIAGTWLTSAYIDPATARALAPIARRFPSVSIFNVDEILAQVRAVLDRAVLAVQAVFGFTLLAGLTVLLAAVQSSREDRRLESAVLRTLGAARGTVLAGVLVEFVGLGTLAGALAACGAALGAWLLATRVLQLSFRPDLMVIVGGVLLGALLVGTAGWLATRSALRAAPSEGLRG